LTGFGGDRFPLPSPVRAFLRGKNNHAIFARLDSTVFESRMCRARPLAAGANGSAGHLPALRFAAAQRAAAARAALANAVPDARGLSADRKAALDLFGQ